MRYKIMKKVLLPTLIIDKITSYVKDDVTLTIKQQKNFIKKLIELWMFIYNKQIIDKDAFSLKSYTNIDRKEFKSFNIQLSNDRLEYKQLINILIELNILDVNEKYSSGLFSKSYRILTTEINNMLSEIDIDIQKVFNFNDEKYWISKNPKHQHLIKDAYKTKIDIISYYNWMIENEGMKLKPVFDKGVIKKRFLTKERIQQYLLMAIKINIGCHWFKLSDEGRFYSSITNLSYTTLPFLSLNSMKLVEIDIPNCQPLLLSTMINSNEYKTDVENSNFYMNMAKELNTDVNFNDSEQAKDAKGSFKILSYKYIFFSPKPLKSGKVYEAMNKIYPGVIEQINTLKEKFNGNLAVELQKMESKIIINNISKINIPKLTRHDSVLVYEAHEDRIKNELIKEFNKINLKIKL